LRGRDPTICRVQLALLDKAGNERDRGVISCALERADDRVSGVEEDKTSDAQVHADRKGENGNSPQNICDDQD